MRGLITALARPADVLPWRLRVPVLVFVVLSAASDLSAGPELWSAVTIVAGTLVLAIAINRTAVGGVLFVALLLLAVQSRTALDLGLATLLMIVLVAATNSIPRTALFVLGCSAAALWSAASGLMQTQDVAWVLLPVYLLIATGAAVVRRHVVQHRRDQAEIVELTERALQARASERRQLAGELHDTVAHNLTLVVMLSAMGSSLDDPERKQRTFARIERTSRSALADLRRLYGVYDRAAAPETDPATNATTVIDDLLAELRESTSALTELGFQVQIREGGDAHRVPGSLRHALRRSLREILSNVAKYAEPASRVDVDYVVSEAAVTLRVCNRLPTLGRARILPKGGTGLVHLQEQADAFGGTFLVGTHDDRWCAELTLPLDPPG